MSASADITVCDLDSAWREIEKALACGDVWGALGIAQCLWALCSCEDEFTESLQRVRAAAWNNLTRLTLDACSLLSTGLNEVQDTAIREGLLVPA